MKKFAYSIVVAALLAAPTFANAGDHMKKNWLEKEMADIQEDYDEAISKINRSSFTEEQKSVLKAQAEANKALAESQAKAVNTQMQKNKEARKGFLNEGNTAHKERKVFEEIDDIL